ncbi:protein odr-4 homolog [Lutzomyia longipalpis]|uniref:protein odr-4 homolog n=1 Tax=Lutzomyia longipalpis TaxID=7200 RepID=UPI0024845A71|nr:protein odr-4 homolog [Lutzomyia longipalpis]
MAPKIRAEKVHKDYLESLAAEGKFRVGYLLGMAETSVGLDGIIVHMAPLPLKRRAKTHPESIADVDSEEMVLQAITLNRMLPGSFTVMGLFVVSPENVLENGGHRKILLQIVKQIQGQFRENSLLLAIEGDEKNFLVLSYTSGKACVCQQIHTKKNVDIEFATEALTWRAVEPKFCIDHNFEMEKIGDFYNIDGNLRKILKDLVQQLEDAYILRATEYGADTIAKVQEDDLVDMLFSSDSDESGTEETSDKMLLLLRTQNDLARCAADAQVPDGKIHLTGKLCCTISVPSKTKLSDVERYLRRDVIRTAAARIQLYIEMMADCKYKMSDIIDLNSDTPLRVFFTVQPTGVRFSDYIFEGEDDDSVRENVKKLMDIDLEPTDIIWVETPEEEQQDDSISRNSEDLSRQYAEEERRAYRNMYIVCFFSTIMLAISMYIMFVWYDPADLDEVLARHDEELGRQWREMHKNQEDTP